jgi:hypothetical protein
VPGVEEEGLQVPVTTVGPVTDRLAGQLAVRPVAGETVVVKVTVPVNPPDGVIVIVELPVAPVLKSAGDVAEIVKSPLKVKTIEKEWDAVPGDPRALTLTENVPAVVELHDSWEVPVPLAVKGTFDGLNGWQVRPGDGVAVRATLPAKLNVLVSVIVEVRVVPKLPVGDVALVVKSPTCEMKLVEWVWPPPVPVIVTR